MVNEEVAAKTLNLAVRTSTSSVRAIVAAMRDYRMRKSYSKSRDTEKKPTGKQSVKELISQGDGVKTVDIDKEGLRDFQKLAKKYGVDFAIVKDKETENPKYTIFFKAKDADALDHMLAAITAKEFGKDKDQPKEKPSILKKLSHFKEIASKTPHKKKHREEKQR